MVDNRYPPDPSAYPDTLTVRGWDQYRARWGISAPKRCRCGGGGWFVMDADQGHPNFAKLVRCERCNHR